MTITNTTSYKTPEAVPTTSTLFRETKEIQGYENCQFDLWPMLSNKDGQVVVLHCTITQTAKDGESGHLENGLNYINRHMWFPLHSVMRKWQDKEKKQGHRYQQMGMRV